MRKSKPGISYQSKYLKDDLWKVVNSAIPAVRIEECLVIDGKSRAAIGLSFCDTRTYAVYVCLERKTSKSIISLKNRCRIIPGPVDCS